MSSFAIRKGAYEATVDKKGATLRTLTHSGRSLLVADAPYAGAVLAPWPNRLANGTYRWRGRIHHAPINESDFGHAIHGFVAAHPWSLRHHGRESVSLDCRIGRDLGFDFDVHLGIRYTVGHEGLTCSVVAQNVGEAAAPFGCGFHPYVRPGDSPVDDWLLTVDASQHLEIDEQTKVPLRMVETAASRFDFQQPRRIGADPFSRAFRIDRVGELRAAVSITDPAGGTVRLYVDAALPWVQVYRPAPSLGVHAVAIEPMTCRPNAFNTSPDEVRQDVGSTTQAAWRLAFSQ
jgi:aldose 1-epimerase